MTNKIAKKPNLMSKNAKKPQIAAKETKKAVNSEHKSDKTRKTRGKMPEGVRFSSENQPKNRRKKELKTVLKELGREISPEVEAKIYETMLAAICCKSDQDAQERLRRAEMEQPEFGWIYQRVILAVKKEGLSAILDVLDRIFGKKSHIDLTSGGQSIAPVELVKFLDVNEKEAKASRKTKKES